MWAYESVFYQIYPLGLCGAPRENGGQKTDRLGVIHSFIPHLVKLGIGAVYMCPVFESDAHGYDTRDYSKIDCRLGSNESFGILCGELHKNNIKVVLDGVFNHVGRGFWAFRDVLEKRENSPYRYWFNIDFGGNSPYNDGLWYEGWEGHYELVKLNLQNNEVVEHLLHNVGKWIDEFDVDGLRLDVAYMLDENFIKRLRNYCDEKKVDFFLLGEMIHGDYNRLLRDDMLHSVTNYEVYKGVYSSFNSMNMFEIAHSLGRQFGPENWTLYRGKHLYNFVDNHDVSRIFSVINDAMQLGALYALLFAMPGIPSIYYGSEWATSGNKAGGDDELRPAFTMPFDNDLTKIIAACAKAKKESKALKYGSYKNVEIQNKFLIFEREYEDERIIVALNGCGEEITAHFNARAGRAVNLLTGEAHDFGGGSKLKPYGAAYWKVE